MKTKISAKETVDIVEQGYYIVNDERIELVDLVENSVKNSVLYTEEYFDKEAEQVNTQILKLNFDTNISVVNCTTMQAAEKLVEKGGKMACLNFASAKNPGGGFLNGAKAQEESLARASALYLTQTRYFSEMYEYNRARDTLLYSDRMIYSPEVPFFKGDNEALLKTPYLMDVLTSPAVNIGAMIKNNKPHDLAQADTVMMQRTDRVLSIFVQHGVEHLILGAWGCGVFRNKPEDVARYFAHYLINEGKYKRCFKNIVFAVFDRSKELANINAFRNVFK